MFALDMLNLGCGSRYQPGWVNVNFTSTGDSVIAANLNEGIPFPNESFDVVYHSHLLEHFTKSAAVDFLKECHRILRPNGIIRVVVPDLEEIARNYLLALENVRAGMEGWDHNYDWMLLEMYDQVVRIQPGGEMVHHLADASLPNEQYVVGRCGAEVSKIIAAARQARKDTGAATNSDGVVVRRILGVQLARVAYRILRNAKEAIVRWMLGNEYELLQTGRFRFSGEIHQWMYDSYSLGRLLMASGFKSVVVRNATESYIPGWTTNNLDTEPDGSVYKPDSLFMEGIRL